jgi:hypothetical protein
MAVYGEFGGRWISAEDADCRRRADNPGASGRRYSSGQFNCGVGKRIERKENIACLAKIRGRLWTKGAEALPAFGNARTGDVFEFT